MNGCIRVELDMIVYFKYEKFNNRLLIKGHVVIIKFIFEISH